MKQLDTPLKGDGFAKLYFLLQGTGTLVSWNAVLNGLDYFGSRYTQYNTDFLLPLSVNVAQVVANFFIPLFGRIFPLKYRIIAPLITLSCLLVFLPIEANLLQETGTGFWIIMTLLFVLGFCNNTYQGSVSGFVGQFPGIYTSYFLMGTGMAGVLMNILRALAIVSFSNMKGGALTEIIVYFAVAGLILIGCGLIHPVFVRTSLCRHYANQARMVRIANQDQSTSELLQSEEGSLVEKKSVFSVFRTVWFYVTLLFVNYVISFVTYPGVMFEKPTPSIREDWKNVSMLGAFNLFDVIGKNLAQYRHLYNKWIVLGIITSRLIFTGFFIVQAITSSIAILNSIWFGYLNIALFGITNGFVTTALFILGPEKVNGERKEIAGFLSVVGLTTGVTVGGFLALPLAHLNAHNS